jgi:hypothetical protein
VDPLRAVAVALLNLSGLGLGYALMRRWVAMALCWIETGILLLVALPADPNGVPVGVLITYLILLGLAALHGAVRGLRTPLSWPVSWPPRSSIAVVLSLVLLAAPVGSVVLYNGAHAEAVQRMFLARLDQADRIVQAAKGAPFGTAEPDYRRALAIYRDLLDNHRSSRAGQLVPDRLSTYYKTVAAPYGQKKYCDAIAPLTYLRALPGTIGASDLGSLATWPDDRLATSLYECGVVGLGAPQSATSATDLGELLTTFPTSPQAAKVEPAVSSAIDKAAEGVTGADPCSATTLLRTLGAQARALPGEKAGVAAALGRDAGRADNDVESGTYACGVAEYKGGDFAAALSTMNDFVGAYPHDGNLALAQKIAIAAQIAQQEPAAGKQLPTLASGGDVAVTIMNDSPDPIEILYTGPATGSVTLGACGSCSTYISDQEGQQFACMDSSKTYPTTTISLPAGTTYFLHEPTGGSTATPNAYTEQYDPGAYTDCAFETQTFSSGL